MSGFFHENQKEEYSADNIFFLDAAQKCLRDYDTTIADIETDRDQFIVGNSRFLRLFQFAREKNKCKKYDMLV